MPHDNIHADHRSQVTGYNDEINLLDYWKVIKRHRKMIVAIVAAVSVIAVIASLVMTKIYRAEALIVPVSSKGGGGGLSALAGQFGGLAQLAGVSLPGGDDASKMVSMLKSRTLIENVIVAQDLMPLLFSKAWDDKKKAWKSDDPQKRPDMEQAVTMMRSIVMVMDDKKNKTIKISAEFKNPMVAARIANSYLDELQRFITDNAFTTAKRNRIFIEAQLEENKQDLLEAGKEINEFYHGSKVSSAEARINVPLGRSTLQVTGDKGIGTRNSELGTRNPGVMAESSPNPESRVPTSGGNPNPESRVPNSEGVADADHRSQVTGHEVEAVLAQKADIEKKLAEARVVKDVPQQVYLSYLMLRRELLGKVNALLTTQYEMAKIEESKEDLAFQVIDYAVPPVKKFKPKRAQICIMSFMAALFIAIFIAFFRDYLERMKSVDRQRR